MTIEVLFGVVPDWGNLRNWLAFLLLRRDPAAQWEIRQFANALGDLIVAKEFPRTWNLFLEGAK